MSSVLLTIVGEVSRPVELRFADLTTIDSAFQVHDVSHIDPKRKGDAVKLAGLLALAGVKPEGTYLTLHSSRDDFHASIPLATVRDKAILIYRLDGQPLPESAGGPVRFFIPDLAACHSAEVDECANVKFVDRIEITAGRGYDNRPVDDDEHQQLHERQGG